MWTLKYEQQLNISHFLCLDYDSIDTKAHGHILTVDIELYSTRLNPNNMVIDTNELKSILDKLDHNSINEYMRINNIRGNATLENIILIIKTKTLMLLTQVNENYNMDIQIVNISIKDETNRQVIYDMQ